MDTIQNSNWSLRQRVVFRFTAAYFSLYFITRYIDPIWDGLITYTGRLLHIWSKIGIKPNGSGDTTYNYIQLLCMIVVAVVITIIWSVLDRKRTGYDKGLYWLLVLLRYGLSFYMITYGFAKVFISQFPFPRLNRLVQPFGNMTPMGLAWRFIGYSPAFSIFTGSLEVIGGVLLVWRRTAIFGSLFSMTVMTSVVAMNLCYDIPVKLFSMHLLLAAIAIATPDAGRIFTFFFLERPAPAPRPYPELKASWVMGVRLTLKPLFVIGIIVMAVVQNEDMLKRTTARKSPLYGIYTVDSFITNGIVIPPLTTDSTRWHQLVVEASRDGGTMAMNSKLTRYEIFTDTAKGLVTLKDSVYTKTDISLHYRFADATHLVLDGMMNKDTVHITLKKKDLNDFLLINRGFHWINEYPLNR